MEMCLTTSLDKGIGRRVALSTVIYVLNIIVIIGKTTRSVCYDLSNRHRVGCLRSLLDLATIILLSELTRGLELFRGIVHRV